MRISTVHCSPQLMHWFWMWSLHTTAAAALRLVHETRCVSLCVCCVLQVPADASVLDVVFSDSSSPNSGFWDTNHSLGYHVPTTGSSVPQPSLSIVHVSVEMAPIAKVETCYCNISATCVSRSRCQSATCDCSSSALRFCTCRRPNSQVWVHAMQQFSTFLVLPGPRPSHNHNILLMLIYIVRAYPKWLK